VFSIFNLPVPEIQTQQAAPGEKHSALRVYNGIVHVLVGVLGLVEAGHSPRLQPKACCRVKSVHFEFLVTEVCRVVVQDGKKDHKK
jgi:hypothetical protein